MANLVAESGDNKRELSHLIEETCRDLERGMSRRPTQHVAEANAARYDTPHSLKREESILSFFVLSKFSSHLEFKDTRKFVKLM